MMSGAGWLRDRGEREEMTAGQAIELADAMRTDNSFDPMLKQLWLKQVDAQLRRSILDRADCGNDFVGKGADTAFADLEGLQEDTELLAPAAFEGLYPHWLCAQMDLALGETARAANEYQQYSDMVQEFGAWMRRNYPPKTAAQFLY